MTCGHCKAAVEKALKAVDGVEDAVVDLENKSANVTLNKEIRDEVLKNAVIDAGYEVAEVKQLSKGDILPSKKPENLSGFFTINI